MLKVVRSMKELPFGQLMKVYEESNTASAGRHYSDVSLERGLAQVENDCYYDLQCGFFTIAGAMYCLWLEEGVCVCAARLEPWRDGMLLTGLETAPDRRNRGYATALLRAVQTYAGEQGVGKIYSHIYNSNAASVHTHEKCGFRKISDCAAYLDGSVDRRGCTYLFEI